MLLLDEIGRFGRALAKAQRHSRAIRDMNALPPELQKDIGWPASQGSRHGEHFRSSYWTSLR